MCLFEVTWFYLEVEETLHIADELIPTFLFLHSLTQQEQSKKTHLQSIKFHFSYLPAQKKPPRKNTQKVDIQKKKNVRRSSLKGNPQ